MSLQALGLTKVVQVGRILQLLAQRGDQAQVQNDVMTPFHSLTVPGIDILLYYVVLSHRAELFDAQAPAVLVLIERICQMAAQRGIPIIVNSFTIHR